MSNVFDVKQACCRLHTEPNFLGDEYEFCAKAPGAEPDQAAEGPLPDDFSVKGVKSWVCGPYSQVAFTEGDDAAGPADAQTFAMSSESYIHNEDVSASTSPLIKGSATGPITKYWIFDYSPWKQYHLGTTIFDQPACAGRSTVLDTYMYESVPPTSSWDEQLSMYEIDPDTVFRSVILEPESELTLVDKDGASHNLVNNGTSPSCEALPDAKFDTFLYAKLN